MKKAIKKFFSVFLVVIMVFGSAPLVEFDGNDLTFWSGVFDIKAEAATNGTCGVNLTWTFDEWTGELTISGSGEMSSAPWCDYYSSIDTVVISDDVTSIYNSAFASCNISNITLPSKLKKIGDKAFYNCRKLSEIIIPNTVTNIGKEAFAFCEMLLTVNLPDGLKSIENGLFNYCINLRNFTFPQGLEYIGSSAFKYCYSLKDVIIPSGINRINNSSFAESGVKNLTIPDTVTSIGNSAFYNCDRLIDLTLPNSVVTIEKDAFFECSNLENITIPSSVDSVGNYAFDNCIKLNNVYYTGTIGGWCSIDFEKYGSPMMCAQNLYINGVLIEGDFVIPNYVFYIGDWTFSYCDNITSVDISDNVITLGVGAFSGCSNLTSVKISDNVEQLSDYLFSNCSNLTNVEISDNVMYLGDYVFSNCDRLTTINIPYGVVEIGESPFDGCKRLKTITVDSDNARFSNDIYGVLYDKNKTELIQFPAGNPQTDYVIPDSVITIGCGAFEDCDRIFTVTMGENVTTISYDAFYDCDNLTEILLINNIATIGDFAFCSCDNITSVTLGTNIKYIGDYSFSDCINITALYYTGTYEQGGKISVGYDNDYLTKNVIYECYSENPYYKKGTCGDNLSWILYTNGELVVSGKGEMTNWDNIKRVPWYNLQSKIKKVTICDGVTTVHSLAFRYYNRLTSITIPSTVTDIYYDSFRGCTSLKSVTLGNGVKFIATFAFADCYELTDVYYDGTEKEWNSNINISSGNDYLINANIHFKSHIHSYTSTIIKEANCTESGFTTYTCECGDSYVSDKVNALGHTESEAVFENRTDVNCGQAGSYDIVVYCSVCGDEISRKTVTVDALTHQYDKVVTAPTCKEGGYSTFICSLCDDTYVDDEVDALGHDIVIDYAVEATCTETGLTEGQHCSRCDDATVKQEIVPTKVHNHTVKIDSIKHWKECACGSKIDIQNHTFNADGVCSCGFIRVVDSTISINNNTSSKTINYGETLKLTASVNNKPTEATIVWYVDGVKKGEGETFNVSFESGTKTVEVKLLDANGNVIKNASGNEIKDSETVTVKAGFFQKLISFFKNLFGMNRTVIQSIFYGVI